MASSWYFAWGVGCLTWAATLGCGQAVVPDGAAPTAGMADAGGQPAAAGKAKATQIAFVGGYQAGRQQASAAGKPLFLFFTAEW